MLGTVAVHAQVAPRSAAVHRSRAAVQPPTLAPCHAQSRAAAAAKLLRLPRRASTLRAGATNGASTSSSFPPSLFLQSNACSKVVASLTKAASQLSLPPARRRYLSSRCVFACADALGGACVAVDSC